MVLEKKDMHMRKSEVTPLLYTIHKNYELSKWITALNLRPKNTKLLKENIGVNFHDLGLGSLLTHKKKHNLGFINIKKLYFNGRYQESEKPAQTLGGNICKS